jgi:osmotically-inducible protein OsmY
MIFLSGCIAIFTNEGASSSAIHTDRRTASSVLIDTSLELDLNQKLNELCLNDGSRVYLKSFNRHIIVLGQTPHHDNIEKISSLLADTEGVKKIYNELSPQPSIALWQQLQDKWITTQIKSSMLLAPQVNPWRIHVLTENNIVYLIGIVKAEEENTIVNIAKKTSGVQKVVKIFEYQKLT